MINFSRPQGYFKRISVIQHCPVSFACPSYMPVQAFDVFYRRVCAVTGNEECPSYDYLVGVEILLVGMHRRRKAIGIYGQNYDRKDCRCCLCLCAPMPHNNSLRNIFVIGFIILSKKRPISTTQFFPLYPASRLLKLPIVNLQSAISLWSLVWCLWSYFLLTPRTSGFIRL
jgi:hypothetical protein